MKKDVIVKWVGSKRKQAPVIVSKFPNKINTYYEPFLGSGAVFRELLDSNVKVDKYVCSDMCWELISIWNLVKDNPRLLLDEYTKRYDEMMSKEGKDRDDYYYGMRYKYNHECRQCPDKVHDFFYLIRSCFNGLPRWNRKCEFNSPFDVRKKGVDPKKLEKTLTETNAALKNIDVEFICCDFEKISPKTGDLVYMDPPYSTLCDGIYINGLPPQKFFDYCKRLRENNVDYLFSYDGKAGDKDYTYEVPKDIWDNLEMIESFGSGFRKFKSQANTTVIDSLYISKSK